MGEVTWRSVILSKLHSHLILISLKVCFISAYTKLLDLIYIFKQSSGEFCFQILKKNRTHQTLKINSRHNKILQCLPTAVKIKSQLLSTATKLSLYDSETLSYSHPWTSHCLSHTGWLTVPKYTRLTLTPIHSIFFFQLTFSCQHLLITEGFANRSAERAWIPFPHQSLQSKHLSWTAIVFHLLSCLSPF